MNIRRELAARSIMEHNCGSGQRSLAVVDWRKRRKEEAEEAEEVLFFGNKQSVFLFTSTLTRKLLPDWMQWLPN